MRYYAAPRRFLTAAVLYHDVQPQLIVTRRKQTNTSDLTQVASSLDSLDAVKGESSAEISPLKIARTSKLTALRSPIAKTPDDEDWICLRRDSLRGFGENQPMQRLLVLDFEASCDVSDIRMENRRSERQEIIEFPAMILDTTPQGNMEILTTFHRYVRPTISPMLTEFCISLTGIQQSTVDAADTFPTVFADFLSWMRTHGLDPDHNYPEKTMKSLRRRKRKQNHKKGDSSDTAATTENESITSNTISLASASSSNSSAADPLSWMALTHGDWDLGICLPKQITLSREYSPKVQQESAELRIPRGFKNWLDLNSISNDAFGTNATLRRSGHGLSDTCRFLRISTAGLRTHSGIDDVKQIVRIVQQMHHLGVKLDERLPTKCCFHCGRRGHDSDSCSMLKDWVCPRCGNDVASYYDFCTVC